MDPKSLVTITLFGPLQSELGAPADFDPGAWGIL